MPKKIFSILQYILFLGGGLFLVWWQLRNMTAEEASEFYRALTHTRYWLILPITLMSLWSHYSRSQRWALLMEPLGYKPAIKNIFGATMVGYLANAAVPRLGEVLKCSLLARYERLPVNKLIGTIILERTFDLICYLMFIGLTLLLQLDRVGHFFKKQLQPVQDTAGIPAGLKWGLILAGILSIWALLRYLFTRHPQHTIVVKIKAFTHGLQEGFSSIRHLKKRRAFLGHTLLIWSLYLGQIYLGFRAMEGTEQLPVTAACSVLTLASLAMILTPGGIGSFPIFVMQTLTIYGIGDAQGKAFGWLMWGTSTAIIIVAGCLALLLLPIMNKRKHEIHTSHS